MKNIIYLGLVQWANFVAVGLNAEQTVFDMIASWFEPKWERPDPRAQNIR